MSEAMEGLINEPEKKSITPSVRGVETDCSETLIEGVSIEDKCAIQIDLMREFGNEDFVLWGNEYSRFLRELFDSDPKEFIVGYKRADKRTKEIMLGKVKKIFLEYYPDVDKKH